MLKSFTTILISLLIGISTCLADNTTINNIFESVAKVKTPGSSGTANCINVDDKYTYWITNYHVAGTARNINLLVYRAGHESQPIPAERIWTAYVNNKPIDICVLRVPKTSFGDWLPTAIQFKDTELLKPGDTCLTIGCPEAGWPKANRGHITRIGNGVYYITPTVIPGQSGSVLFNGDGTKAIGLIAWFERDEGKAMTAETIMRAVKGENVSYNFKQPYNLVDQPVVAIEAQCGPDGCELFRNRQPRQPRPQRPPRDREPLNPQNPYEDNEGPLPDGGDKIFPTYPGDPNDEFVPDEDKVPEAPKEPTPVLPPVDDKFDKFKEENNTKLNSFDSRLKAVEEGLKSQDSGRQNILLTITKLENDVKSFNDSVTKVNEQFNGVPHKDEVITPGKLEETLSSERVNLLQTVDTALKSQIAPYVDTTQKALNDAHTAITSVVKEVQNIQAAAVSEKEVESRIETNNNTFYKEVLATKDSDRYFRFGELSVPWFVIGILGWLLRRHLGGATEPPFVKKK